MRKESEMEIDQIIIIFFTGFLAAGLLAYFY